MNADLRVVRSDSLGAASHYFTGSKQHNIKMRGAAIKKGFKLSEYGVFKGKKSIAGRTEKELFKTLGMQFIPPEIREDTGEIELAQKKSLPELVELADIKGDLHVHSNYTDGSDPIEAIALAAKELGYEFIAITDHSKSTGVAGGLTEKELLEQIDEIDRINKKIKGIKILKGSEVDILPDGSLDFDDGILEQLDIVIGSVHSNFKMGEDEMTDRIIKALRNKYLTILGHPTGRLLSRRDPYKINIDKVINAAAKYGKALELNAYPDRLDLSALHCRLAKEKGVKIAIGTDSHSIGQLKYMRFGIGIARRGWLEKRNVLNCAIKRSYSGNVP
jgi:DNA polymerase (family 10)